MHVLNFSLLVLQDFTSDPTKLLSMWLTLGAWQLQMKGKKMLLHLRAHDLLILLLPVGLCQEKNNLKGKKNPPILILSFSMNIKLVSESAINHYI